MDHRPLLVGRSTSGDHLSPLGVLPRHISAPEDSHADADAGADEQQVESQSSTAEAAVAAAKPRRWNSSSSIHGSPTRKAKRKWTRPRRRSSSGTQQQQQQQRQSPGQPVMRRARLHLSAQHREDLLEPLPIGAIDAKHRQHQHQHHKMRMFHSQQHQHRHRDDAENQRPQRQLSIIRTGEDGRSGDVDLSPVASRRGSRINSEEDGAVPSPSDEENSSSSDDDEDVIDEDDDDDDDNDDDDGKAAEAADDDSQPTYLNDARTYCRLMTQTDDESAVQRGPTRFETLLLSAQALVTGKSASGATGKAVKRLRTAVMTGREWSREQRRASTMIENNKLTREDAELERRLFTEELGNVCWLGGREVQDFLGRQTEVLESWYQDVQQQGDDDLVLAIFHALGEMCKNHSPNQSIVGALGWVDLLIDMLDDEDSRFRMSACRCLYLCLLNHKDNQTAALRRSGELRPMLLSMATEDDWKYWAQNDALETMRLLDMRGEAKRHRRLKSNMGSHSTPRGRSSSNNNEPSSGEGYVMSTRRRGRRSHRSSQSSAGVRPNFDRYMSSTDIPKHGKRPSVSKVDSDGRGLRSMKLGDMDDIDE